MNYFDDDAAWEAFRREAESWLGTPYRHLQRCKGRGADCTLFIGQALLDAGDVYKRQLLDMTPGELEEVWEKVKEVNAAFFKIAGALGFGRVLEAFRAQLRSDLMEAALGGVSSTR